MKSQLHIDLCEIDYPRFVKIIEALQIDDTCIKCDFFNLSIKDQRQQYRCKCSPSCIADTLHPRLISYFNWKLGLITQEEHFENCSRP